MTVTAVPQIYDGVTVTIDVQGTDAVQAVIDGFKLQGLSLDTTSSPPVSKVSYREYALSAGTITIDLTAILDQVGVAQDCTGLKVQKVHAINPEANSQIAIAAGASNGYSLGGTITIPGSAEGDCHVVFYLPEALADISASAKSLTITGTGSQTFSLGFDIG